MDLLWRMRPGIGIVGDMDRLRVALLWMAACTPTWSAAARATEVTSVGLLVCDGGTTEQFLGNGWNESNPILGNRPSPLALWGYLGTAAALVVIGNRSLSPRWAVLLNTFVIGAEVRSIAHNIQVGASAACGVGAWQGSPIGTAR